MTILRHRRTTESRDTEMLGRYDEMRGRGYSEAEALSWLSGYYLIRPLTVRARLTQERRRQAMRREAAEAVARG